jgi:hypothetical protein
LSSLQLDIRIIKKNLFASGRWTSSQGFSISVDELLTADKVRVMKENIAQCLVEMIRLAEHDLKRLYDVRTNYIRQIDLAFAGGGASLDFIRSSLPNKIDLGDGIVLPIKQVEPVSCIHTDLEETLQARLAVCAGGVTPAREWPTNNPDAARFGPNDFGSISGVSI